MREGRFIKDKAYDGQWNMALDEVLFSEADFPCVRFYSWLEPTVSIGCLSPWIQDFNGQKVVRRFTGGGQVFHKEDITFSIVIPKKYNKWSNIIDSYKDIHELVQKSLYKLEIFADSYTKDDQVLPTLNCFERPVRYDLMWQNKKILGGAQRRRKGKILYQGSMKMTWVQSDLDKWIDVFLIQLQEYFDIIFKDFKWSESLYNKAFVLIEKKYNNSGWNKEIIKTA